MLNNDLSERISAFLGEYLEFYKSFLEIENKKFENISKGELDLLDKSVKNEEAYMLKSRGLEIKRDKLLSEAGNSKATFRELIEMLNPPYSTKAKKIFQELSQVLLDLKEINNRCNCITELKIKRADREIEKLKNNPELKKQFDKKVNTLYDSNANNKSNTSNSFFSKKI